MKVLHIVGDSAFGGGAMVIAQVAGLGKELGWDVDVLTTNGEFQRVLVRKGIGVIRMPGLRRPISPAHDATSLLRLTSFLRRNRYQLVHTHTSKAGFLGRLAGRLARVPVIVHNVHGFAFHEGSSRSIIRACAALERAAARWCDLIVTVSRFHREWALSLGIAGPEKLVSIPNGVDPGRAVPTRSREETRTRLGIGSGEFVVAATGRLAPQKGLEYLIRAVPLLRHKTGCRLRVVLVGEGPLKPALTRLGSDLGVDDALLFLGFREDIGDLLAAADAVVLPSWREGLSIALLEAMAASRPVVATNIGSNVEASDGGRAALLVPPRDAAALARAIERLCTEEGLRERLALAGQARFRAEYTEARMLAGYRERYLELVRRRELS
jgi:glycosyltransferase involved in cell wall biosynthesis